MSTANAPRIIAVANQKGGVGKTTTAVNLAAELAKRDPVLVVDLDPQGNSTIHLGTDPDQLEVSMHDVLRSEDRPLAEIIRPTGVENLDLAPADLTLSGCEIELTTRIGRETVLREKLEALADRYAFIVLDVAPSLGLLCLNALTAAAEVIVPVQTQFLSLKGLHQLLQVITLVQNKLHHELRVRFLATMVDTRTNMSRVALEELEKLFPESLLKTRIHVATKLSECPIHGKPVRLYAPSSRATREYRRLAREVRDE